MDVSGLLSYLVSLAIMGGIYAIFALGLNVQWGYTGLFNIGIAGFQKDISGGQNWLVFILLQALGFTAGVLVLLQGVRMLIAEIVPAAAQELQITPGSTIWAAIKASAFRRL